MLRRNFLGQLLGLAAGTPFFARLLQDVFPTSCSPFKLGVIFSGDDEIYHAPAIVDITYKIIDKQGYLEFMAEKLDCHLHFIVSHAALLENRMMLRDPIRLKSPIFVNPGDTLHFKYLVTVSGPWTLPQSTAEAIAALRGQHN